MCQWLPWATLGLLAGCLKPSLGYSGYPLGLTWAYLRATLTCLAAALGLWTDLRDGNVNISFVLTFLFERCLASCVFLNLLYDLF